MCPGAGRMEQRNGRIDRTLQRSPRVHCHYFVLPQRPEDSVLDTVVRKTDQIRQELGCLPGGDPQAQCAARQGHQSHGAGQHGGGN